MDLEKKPVKFLGNRNNRMYMDFKDIIREQALQFLPAKALCRCRAVCRDWKLYVSTPFFAHNQSIAFRTTTGFFCQSASGVPKFITPDPLASGVPDPSLSFLPEPVEIRSVSNGLLCCQGRTGYKAYYVCNPVTRQWKKLPKPSAAHGTDPAIVLIFEPSLLNFVAEYMLVCAFPSDLDGYEFEIYSSAEGSWRISSEIWYGNRQILSGSGVYAGGVIYWQMKNDDIFAFDINSERATTLRDYYSSYLGNYSSSLDYYSSPLGQGDGKLIRASISGTKLSISSLSNAFTNTMRMDSKESAWQVKQQVDLLDSMGDLWCDQGGVRCLGDDLVVIQSGYELTCYNIKTKEFKQFVAEAHRGMRLFPYVNNLAEI